jgi:molybdenum cofactor cytidylyltransferase
VTVSAIVLAAGAGQRLGGVCKALLCTREGETYLARVTRRAREAGCAEIVVVVAAPFGDAVAAVAEGRIVWNRHPEVGMASSIACGIAVATGDVALVWPVDHPSATTDSVRAVLAVAAADVIVVPTFEGRGGHPTAFGRGSWAELAAIPADGARQVVRRDPSRVRRVPVADRGVIDDVDLPGDQARP